MSAILTIGSLAFDVVSLNGFSLSREMPFPEQKIIQGQPVLQNTGTGLKVAELRLRLHARLGDPEQAIDVLDRDQRAGTPLDVSWASGRVEGSFVIKSLSTALRRTDFEGRLISVDVTLNLREVDASTQAASPISAALSPTLARIPLPSIAAPAGSVDVGAVTRRAASSFFDGVASRLPGVDIAQIRTRSMTELMASSGVVPASADALYTNSLDSLMGTLGSRPTPPSTDVVLALSGDAIVSLAGGNRARFSGSRRGPSLGSMMRRFGG